MGKDLRKQISRRWIECLDFLKDQGEFSTYKEVQDRAGVPVQSITDIRAGRKDVTIDMLVSTRNVYGINTYYVLYGEGHRLEKEVVPSIKINSSEDSAAENYSNTTVKERLIVVDQQNNPVAPFINYKAAASYTGYDSQEMLEHTDSISLPSTLVKAGEHMVFPVIGDSMEPTFQAKDYVLCRRVMRPDWQFINDFTVCVIYSTTHGLQLKRLKIRPKQNLIRCKSDNRTHRSYNLDMDDVLEVWRFEWRLTASAENVTENVFMKVDNLEDTVHDLRLVVESLMDETELKRLLDLKSAKKK